MKQMTDFSAISSHLENNNFPYFNFYPKSQKPIKAVLHHLPYTTPAEDISDGLINIEFDVISTRQMSVTRQSPAERTTAVKITPLFYNLT
jgi:hypothetical protein